jgi:hypothetical protein
MSAQETGLGDNIEIDALESFMPCPDCRYCNDIENRCHKLLIEAVGKGRDDIDCDLKE